MLQIYPGVLRSCLAAVLVLSFGCASLSEVPPDSYDLTGVWQLNAAISDSPSLASLLKPARGQMGQRPTGQGGGRGGPPPSGGRGQGPGGGGQAGGGGRGRLRVPSLEAKQIDIQQDAESMGLAFDGANYRDVSWGKRKRGEQTIVAGWKDRDLIVKTTGSRVAIEERFVLAADGQRLTLYIELNGGKDDLKFVRVYEPLP